MGSRMRPDSPGGRTTLPAAASWVGTPSLFISHTPLLDLLHSSKEVRNRWFQVPRVAGSPPPWNDERPGVPTSPGLRLFHGLVWKDACGAEARSWGHTAGAMQHAQPPEQTPTAALQDEFFMEAHSRREKKFRHATC